MLHGVVFETTIPTIGERGFSLEKIVLWSTGKWKKGPDGNEMALWPGEAAAVRLLAACLELDPHKRITAEEALEHEFLTASAETERREREQMGLEVEQVDSGSTTVS